MTYDNSLVEDVNRYVEAFESTRDYLESGGDINIRLLEPR